MLMVDKTERLVQDIWQDIYTLPWRPFKDEELANVLLSLLAASERRTVCLQEGMEQALAGEGLDSQTTFKEKLRGLLCYNKYLLARADVYSLDFAQHSGVRRRRRFSALKYAARKFSVAFAPPSAAEEFLGHAPPHHPAVARAIAAGTNSTEPFPQPSSHRFDCTPRS